MKYLSVRNWAQFQHYKDRNPLWIKLHVSLLDDYEFGLLSDVAQAHVMKLWILASKMDNKIPHDLSWLTQRIGAKSPIDIEELILRGYLEPYTEQASRGKREDWASRYVSAQTRAALLSRFEHKCAACGSTKNLEIDHIIPISKGGTGDVDNLQVLCRPCNRKKRVQLKQEESAHLRSKPLRTQSVPRSLETEKRQRREESTDAHASVPENWVARGVELWRAKVGDTTHPRLGKALSGCVATHGADAVMLALAEYADAPNNGRPKKLEWFAEDIVRWIGEAKEPLEQDGVLTAKGRRFMGVAS